jgi:hypothetical protein
VRLPAALRTERMVLRPMSSGEAVIASSTADFATRGFGLWTAWLVGDHRLAGFAGLRVEADTGRVELPMRSIPRGGAAAWPRRPRARVRIDLELGTDRGRARNRPGQQEQGQEDRQPLVPAPPPQPLLLVLGDSFVG